MSLVRKVLLVAAIVAAGPLRPLAAQRFMFTGVTDAEVLAFFGKFQKAMNANDRRTVVAMVNYPLRVNSRGGTHVSVATAADLLRQYDAVFTPAIRKAVAAETPARLSASREGAAMGAGLVWFTGRCVAKRTPRCILGVVSVNHE